MGSVVENPKKVVGAEPGNSLVAGTSPDGKWTLPIQGGRLHRGCNKSPGRPKKEIRAKAMAGSELAVLDDLRIMRESKDPAERDKAKERLYRYGLGTKDEVQIADAKVVLQAVGKALALHAGQVMDAQVAESVIAEAMTDLGLE